MPSNNNFTQDLTPEEFRQYGYKFIDWCADYLKEIESYPALSRVQPGDIKNKLPQTPPQKHEELSVMLNDVENIILPGVTHWNHPGFMAYFNSSASGAGILADLISTVFNSNGMLWKSSPASAELEETVLGWLRQMIGLDENFWGIIYDTASVSSMHAIAAARENINLNVNQNGLSGIPKLRLYCSPETHSSVEKGAVTLGIGKEGVRKIPVDDKFRMIPGELKKAITGDRLNGWLPFCTVATVGTTGPTSVDPVKEIAAICREENLWLHVDAAYAGSAAILPEMRHFFEGINEADSFLLNPHKWLFTPIDLSVLYTRHPQVLKNAFSLVPEYLRTAQDSFVINYMDYGIQLGRRFRSLKLWFVIRYFGVEGLQNIIREHISLAKELAEWITANPSFEILAPVNFSTVCFRAKVPGLNENELNAFNEKLMDKINAAGNYFISHTKLNGIFTIRVVIASIKHQHRHVEEIWELIQSSFKSLL